LVEKLWLSVVWRALEGISAAIAKLIATINVVPAPGLTSRVTVNVTE